MATRFQKSSALLSRSENGMMCADTACPPSQIRQRSSSRVLQDARTAVEREGQGELGRAKSTIAGAEPRREKGNSVILASPSRLDSEKGVKGPMGLADAPLRLVEALRLVEVRLLRRAVSKPIALGREDRLRRWAVAGAEYGERRDEVDSTSVDERASEVGVFLLWKAASPRCMMFP